MVIRGFWVEKQMAVFHFTLHAYRSWNTDNPRGYVQHGEYGIKPQNVALGRVRDQLASFPPVVFDEEDRQFLVEQSHDVTQRRSLKLYGVTVIETHLHLVMGWEEQRDENEVQTQLKRGFGFVLAQRHGTKGRPYFSRGGVPQRVKDIAHLRRLLDEYLPGHNGVMWRARLAESQG